MTDDANSHGRDEPLGLTIRHVFLDTAIYRQHGHDLTRAPIKALASHLSDEWLNLHFTDITLLEIKRQIYDDAVKLAGKVGEFGRSLDRWRSMAPGLIGNSPEPIDAEAVARAAFSKFRLTLYRWNAKEHKALDLPAASIFERYFERKPPFDDQKSNKEFPDAFVIAALEDWCRRTGSNMYVVTTDKAMLRAADESDLLVPVTSLEELLEMATAAETPDIVERVERILRDAVFETKLSEAIRADIGWVGTVYRGDLIGGDVYEIEFLDELEVESFSVLSASSESIDVLMRVKVRLLVQASYQDIVKASYDSETHEYIGAETEYIEFENTPIIQVLVEIDPSNDKVLDITIMTRDVYLSEPYEDYK